MVVYALKYGSFEGVDLIDMEKSAAVVNAANS